MALKKLSRLSEPTYWYVGSCPLSGQELRLPRTPEIEHLARQWMTEMVTDIQFHQEGKMYGLLLARSVSGDIHTLKAFSGLWQGQSAMTAWVPPLPGRETLGIAEIDTIQRLAALGDQISIAHRSPCHGEYAALLTESRQQRDRLNTELQACRSQRQEQRAKATTQFLGDELAIVLTEIDQASKADSRRKRELKEYWQSRLQPLSLEVDRLNTTMCNLKQQRQIFSRTLQTQLHQTTTITNFTGETKSLKTLCPDGLPTGSGECCAPKLLHYAASQQLTPVAMAEFWWGPTVGDKQPGVFYGACADRCQPLMGFMLSGLAAEVQRRIPTELLEIIYQTPDLVAIDKPHGLLSVPGRYGQPNVQQLLEQQLATKLYPAHRLDQDTSGVLLFAKNLKNYHWIAKQFAERRVQKVYWAVVAGHVQADEGVIELPLAADLHHRPKQKVDQEFGKPSITQFRVIKRQDNWTWVELRPFTGRTHQLRVHMAMGLGAGILGDRLYTNESAERLYLHAQQLTIPLMPTSKMASLVNNIVITSSQSTCFKPTTSSIAAKDRSR